MNDLVNRFKDQKLPIESYSKMIYKKLQEEYPNIGVNRMYDAYARYLMNSGQDISIYINRPRVA